MVGIYNNKLLVYMGGDMEFLILAGGIILIPLLIIKISYLLGGDDIIVTPKSVERKYRKCKNDCGETIVESSSYITNKTFEVEPLGVESEVITDSNIDMAIDQALMEEIVNLSDYELSFVLKKFFYRKEIDTVRLAVDLYNEGLYRIGENNIVGIDKVSSLIAIAKTLEEIDNAISTES